jgi:hypothetical protein
MGIKNEPLSSEQFFGSIGIIKGPETHKTKS